LIVREKGVYVDGWASSKGVVPDLQLSGTWTTEPHSKTGTWWGSKLESGLDSVELEQLSLTQTWIE
jgi:hypothetical protein